LKYFTETFHAVWVTMSDRLRWQLKNFLVIIYWSRVSR